MCIFFPVVVLLVLKSRLTFVNRTSFYINAFLTAHSLIYYFISECEVWSFSGWFYYSLSLEVSTLNILELDNFYSKTEEGKSLVLFIWISCSQAAHAH